MSSHLWVLAPGLTALAQISALVRPISSQWDLSLESLVFVTHYPHPVCSVQPTTPRPYHPTFFCHSCPNTVPTFCYLPLITEFGGHSEPTTQPMPIQDGAPSSRVSQGFKYRKGQAHYQCPQIIVNAHRTPGILPGILYLGTPQMMVHTALDGQLK